MVEFCNENSTYPLFPKTFNKCGGLNIKTSRSPALVQLRTPIYIKSARVLRYNSGLSAELLKGV